MFDTIETMVDRARQRQFTDEEITALEADARHCLAGVEAADKVKAQEVTLVGSALAALRMEVPSLERDVPGATELIQTIVTMVLRQAAFAAAVGDPKRLTAVLCTLQQAVWESGLGGNPIEAAMEGLRDALPATLGDRHGALLDAWLKPASRFLTVTGEVGRAQGDIVRDATARLLARFPDAAGRYPDGERKIREDFALVLMHTIRGSLPGGNELVFAMLRPFHDAMQRSRFDVAVIEEGYRFLLEACQARLGDGRSTELFIALPEVIHFIAASADLATQMESIVEGSVAALYAKYPNLCLSDEYREKTKRDERLILEHCLFGSHPGGEDLLLQVASEFWLTLQRYNFGGRFITDAYKLLFERCRQQLRGRTRAQMLGTLHRVVHFLSIAADLAEKQETMLAGVLDELARKHGAMFEAAPFARAYVTRDQEQMLFNLALGLLPGAGRITVDRFSIFGETLLSRGFDARMMGDSFTLLETAMLRDLQSQSVSHLIPRWRRLRRYLEACAALGANEATLIETCARDVSARFSSEVARYPHGAEKVARDLRAVLRAALLYAAPDGEVAVARGMARFLRSIGQAEMDPTMLGSTYAALNLAAMKQAPQADWLPTVINGCRLAAESWATYCRSSRPAVRKIADEACRSDAGWAQRYRGASRRAAEDLERIVWHAVLALVPGGERSIAEGLRHFATAIRVSRFGSAALRATYEALATAVKAPLGKELGAAVGVPLAALTEAIGVCAEAAEREPEICRSVLDELLAKHAGVERQYADARARAESDLSLVLRYASVASTPGGERAFARMLELFGEAVLQSRFPAAMMHDAYSLLASVSGRVLTHPAKRNLVARLTEARDYLSLMAGLGACEETILDESWRDFAARHRGALGKFADSEGETRFDQRMVLRSSVRALLPGGKAAHDEIVDLMRVVAAHRKFDRAMLIDAYAGLQTRCQANLAVGPVRELGEVLKQSARAFAA